MIKSKDFKIYKPFTLNTFKTSLSYKWSVFMFVLGSVFTLVVTYFLWKSIYSSSGEEYLNSFNFNQMIIYILITFIINLLLSSDVSYNVSREVKSGSISNNLLKPVDYSKIKFFQYLGDILFNFLLLGAIALIITTILLIKSTNNFSLNKLLLFLISLILSCIINFYLSYFVGLLSFKITNMWGANQIIQAVSKLVSGTLIPLSFFPNWAKLIMDILPFSSTVYTPSMIYLNKFSNLETFKYMSIQVFWIILFYILTKIIWKKLIKQLVVVGG